MRSVSQNSSRRGIALIVTAAMSIVVLPMVGLSIDVGILYIVKTKLSAATDAAAIAGARTLNRGVDFNAQKDNAVITAGNYFRANFTNGYLLTTNSSITTTVTASGLNSRIVASTATATVPLYFLRFLKDGQPSVTVNTAATATRRDSNVILVMDRSRSLKDSFSCEPMKVAAAGFVDKFAEQTDFLGLVTFASSSYYIDYPIVTNFKSGGTSMTSVISSVDCNNGATNSAQGLWNGYTALAQLNQPGALNVIVFFTDGDPTAFPATFPIKTTSPCTNKSSKTAVLSETTDAYGLLNLSNGPVPITNDNVRSTTTAGGCQFTNAGADKVSSDVASIPALDFFGDSTTGYYTPVISAIGSNGSTNATSIDNAALNAADNAARRIRDGVAITAVIPGAPIAAVGRSLAGVVIFSLGLGNSTNPPNSGFLERVANTTNSSSYDLNRPQGIYIEIKTIDDLDDAFSKVASEVLRLSK